MKKKIGIKEEYIFSVFVCLIFAFGMYSLVKEPSLTSIAENRSLTQFKHFTVGGFLGGKFQDSFEDALADQFPKSEYIRVKYGEIVNNLSTFGFNRLICRNRYIYLSGWNSTNTMFNCDDYIISPPMNIDPKQKDQLESGILDDFIDYFSYANEAADTYYYFIDEAQTFNFETSKKVIDLKEVLKEKLHGKYVLSSLQYNDYEDQKKYFYKTDHHWNYIGSYQGYRDIANMFGVEPIEPIGVVTNHEHFFGSKARDSQKYDFREEFAVYEFSIPEHDTFINGKLGQYGHYQDFAKHNYQYKRDTNYYGWVYGGDPGELLFDFSQPNKENLLIVSNSFSNPINVLVAQHFNKTYIVDPRNYKNELGKAFCLSEYIKDNKIDKVLFIISPRFLYDQKAIQGLEN